MSSNLAYYRIGRAIGYVCGSMLSNSNLWELLNAGDWACAHADEEALVRAAGDIAPHLERELADTAKVIGLLAGEDLRAATALWGRLAKRLRDNLPCPQG